MSLLTRKEAAEIANVSPSAITMAVDRGDLTKIDLDPGEYRKNGLYILNDDVFTDYCEHIKNSNYKKSGRKRLEM